jgi:hypothetical protein
MATAGSSFSRGQTASSKVVVTDFGADPTGVRDSTIGIAAAVQQVRTKGAHTLVFPKGTYRVSSASDAAIDLENLPGIEVDGGGSTIVMGKDATCLNFVSCHNLYVHDLVIDYNPLPFVQGNVIAATPNSFVLELDPGYSFLPNTPIYSFGVYDRRLRLRARSPLIEWDEDVKGIQHLDGSRYRIQVNDGHALPAGSVALVRHTGKHHAVFMRNITGGIFERVTIYASYLFAFNITQSRDLTFRDVHITIPSDGTRLMSTNRDGLHITQTRGNLNVQGGEFFGMGDDSINIFNPIVFARVEPDGTVAVTNSSGSPVNLAGVGQPDDLVEILDPKDLHPLTNDTPISELEDRLRSVATHLSSSFVITNPNMTPITRITDCHFLGSRVRGIVVHNHAEIRNCIFRNTSSPAILLAPHPTEEGPATRDVTIDGNHFSNCDYGSRDPEGTITADIGHVYWVRPKTLSSYTGGDLKITNNTFEDCYTAAISVRALNKVVITGNEISKTWVASDDKQVRPAIIATHLANSTISDNVSTALNVISVNDSVQTTVATNRGFRTTDEQ